MEKVNPYIVGDIVLIVVTSILFYYIHNLESSKCLCAKNWKQDYIKMYSISVFIILILSLITPMMDYCGVIKELISIASLINIPILYLYIRELKQSDCVCAIEKHENLYEFLKFYSLIGVILVVYTVCVIISINVNKFNLLKYKNTKSLRIKK